jgi:hypothetical protein
MFFRVGSLARNRCMWGRMTRMRAVRLAAAGGWAALLLTAACGPVQEKGPRFGNVVDSAAKTTVTLFPVAPPPFSDGIFPCSQCHGPTDKVNRTPHVVDFHSEIVLQHDEKNRWCLDCHDARNRDKLHLADGRLIDFTESYRLCGQCHGPTLRNWKAGEHGKRTGSWSGAKQYLLCASCHSPHSPHFKPLKPKAPPLRQEAIR